MKYTVNNKINNNSDKLDKKSKKDLNEKNNKEKNIFNLLKKTESFNYASNNQYDNTTNHGYLDINGHFIPELLERNKLTCSFRKLRSSNGYSKKNSGQNFTSNFIENMNDKDTSNIDIPFQYASKNSNLNKLNSNREGTNKEISNTYNSNILLTYNNTNINNYNTKDTINRKKNLYNSFNQSILNCSALAIKIFSTAQEKTAKNIEEGFEKLQRLARNLKIIEPNKQNTRVSNLFKYDNLLDILEFKGLGKEIDIIDKNIQKKKNLHYTEKKPFISNEHNSINLGNNYVNYSDNKHNYTNLPYKATKINKIREENNNSTYFSEMKKKYKKNSYETNSKIEINDIAEHISDREISNFNKGNFLFTTKTNPKNNEFDYCISKKYITKDDYCTNLDSDNQYLNAKLLKNSSSLLSQEDNVKETNLNKINYNKKNSQNESYFDRDFSDERNYEENKNVKKNLNKRFCSIVSNPFKNSSGSFNNNSAINKTDGKGLPPKTKNIFTSSKKELISRNQNFSTNKRIKESECWNPFNFRSSSGFSKSFNFNEELEKAEKMPFLKITNNENTYYLNNSNNNACKNDNIDDGKSNKICDFIEVKNNLGLRKLKLNRNNNSNKNLIKVNNHIFSKAKYNDLNEYTNADNSKIHENNRISIKLDKLNTKSYENINFFNNDNNNDYNNQLAFNSRFNNNSYMNFKNQNKLNPDDHLIGNCRSNFTSNNNTNNNNIDVDTTSIFKTNEKNCRSNYDTNEIKEVVNENSYITSASILTCNMDCNSSLPRNNSDTNNVNYNANTNNMKTNEVYSSNSFIEYNTENGIDSEFYSNITNNPYRKDEKNNYFSNYKNFKNDFDNYEEYQSAMRKMDSYTLEDDNSFDDAYRSNDKNVYRKNNSKNKKYKTSKSRFSINSNNKNNNTESDYISDFSKNSRVSNNTQINNFSYITKSSNSDNDL